MAAGSVKRRRYKRKDGSAREVWRAQLPNPSKGGAAKIERQFTTKRDAERWIAQQATAVARGEWIDPADGQRTFATVADEWRATWVGLEPKTRSGYESILGRIGERFERARIAAMTPDVIQTYVNGLAEKKATNTVRRYFTVLGSVMRVAVERRYIAANPCDSVRLPKRRNQGRRGQVILTPNEVAALAEAIEPDYRVAIYTAAYTGLRAGELWALRRCNVRVLAEPGTLRINEALKDVRGHLSIGPPKSEAGRRTVPLPEQVRELLAEHLGCVSPGGNGPDDLVFTTPTGKPVRHNLFYRRAFRPAVEAALPAEKQALRFHDLRHTCASLSLAVEPNLHLVKQRLGHEDIRTTVNTYGHLCESVDDAIARGLDAMFTTEPESDDSTGAATNVVGLIRR